MLYALKVVGNADQSRGKEPHVYDDDDDVDDDVESELSVDESSISEQSLTSLANANAETDTVGTDQTRRRTTKKDTDWPDGDTSEQSRRRTTKKDTEWPTGDPPRRATESAAVQGTAAKPASQTAEPS